MLLERDPDIVTITQIWLQDQIADSEKVSPNYTIVQKDRSSCGGGVVKVLKKGIVFSRIPGLAGVESLWLKNFFLRIVH